MYDIARPINENHLAPFQMRRPHVPSFLSFSHTHILLQISNVTFIFYCDFLYVIMFYKIINGHVLRCRCSEVERRNKLPSPSRSTQIKSSTSPKNSATVPDTRILRSDERPHLGGKTCSFLLIVDHSWRSKVICMCVYLCHLTLWQSVFHFSFCPTSLIIL